MIIPHKWPGKKKIVVICAYMRMIDTRPLEHQPAWNKIADASGNELKKWWRELRYHFRSTIEVHQQKGKDNG